MSRGLRRLATALGAPSRRRQEQTAQVNPIESATLPITLRMAIDLRFMAITLSCMAQLFEVSCASAAAPSRTAQNSPASSTARTWLSCSSSARLPAIHFQFRLLRAPGRCGPRSWPPRLHARRRPRPCAARPRARPAPRAAIPPVDGRAPGRSFLLFSSCSARALRSLSLFSRSLSNWRKGPKKSRSNINQKTRNDTIRVKKIPQSGGICILRRLPCGMD